MYTEPVDSNTGGHNVGEIGVKPPRLHDYWPASNMQGCYFYRVVPQFDPDQHQIYYCFDSMKVYSNCVFSFSDKR